jgi:nitronate monooxygenase
MYTAFHSSASLKASLQSVRTKLNLQANSPVPVGVGFLGWILDNTETSDDPRIVPVLDELPAAVWFAFGNDLGKYIAQVQAYDAKRAHKTIIFVIVNSIADALRAANEWKVDVLVVQGTCLHQIIYSPSQT